MLVVGLTGGIGSGKSAVADLFANLGVPIIDADIIARDITQPHSPALAKISAHFGAALIQKDGSLDRAALRKIIFDDATQRNWLEELLHPLIQTEIENSIKRLSAPYCIVVIPLLFEVEPFPFIARTLVVDAPEHAQIKRVIARDRISKAHVEAILGTQIGRTLRLSQADDVITNDGVSSLEPQVQKLHEAYSRMDGGQGPYMTR